jgi:hypothetical protein
MIVESNLYSLPYIIFYIVIFPLNIIQNSKVGGRNLRILAVYVVVICVVYFLGFRGYLYSDWVYYYQEYQTIPTGIGSIRQIFEKYKMEFLFYLYMSLLKSISIDYLFFQVISFMIDLIILYAFVKRYIRKYPVLFSCLYFILGGLIIEINLIRNVKAIMFFLISIDSLEKKKYWQYILLNTIGMFFHSSAVVYILLTPILNRKINDKSIIFIFLIANVVYLCQIAWVVSFLSWVLRLVNLENISRLLVKYTAIKRYSDAYGFSLGYLERSFTFMLIFCFRKKLYAEKGGKIFFNITIAYLLVYLLFSEMRIFIERFTLLFLIGYCITYPRIYSMLSKTMKEVFLLLMLLYGCLRLYNTNYVNLAYYDNILWPSYLGVDDRLAMYNVYKLKIDTQ